MDLKVNVKYGNGNACFMIHRESPGIYSACLVYFDGPEEFLPPSNITLVRGVRQWTGSYNNIDLLNELGKIIEESHVHPSKAQGK